MKKRFLIGTSIMAIVLSLGLLFYGVYSVFMPGFLVNNTISFEGSKNVKFSIYGEITGTKDRYSPNLKHLWEYDYENSATNEDYWDVGSIEFDSEYKSIEDIHITYTFLITNLSESVINAEFSGPDGVTEPLKVTQSVKEGEGAFKEGSSVNVAAYGTATMTLKLTLTQIEDIHVNQLVSFSINLTAI